MSTQIRPALEDDLNAIRELLEEYQQWLGLDLSFQGFRAEVDGLPGAYAPPHGALLLAEFGDAAAGMVALRRVDAERCEMKRLFVRSAARGHGLGRQLATRIIDEARARGYREIVLDTLPVMTDAQRLYVSLGFVDIPPYYPSPIEGTRYLAYQL